MCRNKSSVRVKSYFSLQNRAYPFVCVWERERGRGREKKRERVCTWEKESEWESLCESVCLSACVCVFVCVCARARSCQFHFSRQLRVSLCVWGEERERKRVGKRVCVRGRESEWESVCERDAVSVCLCVHVCVCVWVRVRKKTYRDTHMKFYDTQKCFDDDETWYIERCVDAR